MDSHVEPVPLHQTAQERYLNYALSVITSRALPDVRDGLKPVQRRILYGMHDLRLTPDSRYRKSAQVVGHVMGRYHPHGDSAIYDAMVRMAQPFSLRYVLVDGQGNFGSLDGDGAAAMRYTEARMAPLAMALLDDLSERIVPFRDTYDASDREPTVLPAGVPNLLVNGATGIAVGMATNIPPHNLTEIVDACVAMIDDRDLSIEAACEIVRGPDFPTGGRILNSEKEIRKIYETGRGTIDIRGEYELEKEGRRKRLVITSIPYMTDKSQLVEKIADHIRSNRIPQLVDIRDESTDEVRVVLDLKSKADPETAMAYLFKHTPLQSRFHVNLTCLVPVPGGELDEHGVLPVDYTPTMRPAQIGLLEMLRHFLDFRFEVVTRRLQVQLEKLLERIHILEGFETIFDALDEAIEIIRSSRDRADAGKRLRARFGLSTRQSDAVLEIRLYRLAQLEIEKIRSELETKRSEAAHIRGLLESPKARWKLVRRELIAMRKRFGDERRSHIAGPDVALSYSKEDYIVDENVFVIVSRDGWIKRMRSYSDISTIRLRDGDEVGWIQFGSTRRTVIFFSDRGRAYTMRVNAVPMTTGYGDPIQAHFDFEDGERIVGVLVTDDRSLPEVTLPDPEDPQASLFDEDELSEIFEDDEDDGDGEGSERVAPQIVAVTTAGQTMRMKFFAFEAPSTVAGRMYMRLQDDADRVVGVEIAGGGELVSLASRNSRCLTFPVVEISLLKNPGKGVRAISMDAGDRVLGFTLISAYREGLVVETNRGREVKVTSRRFPPVSRASRGKLLLKRGYLAKVLRDPSELKPLEDPDDEALEDGLDAAVEDTESEGESGHGHSTEPSDDDGDVDSSEEEAT